MLNPLDGLRMRYRVHRRLMALEMTGSLVLGERTEHHAVDLVDVNRSIRETGAYLGWLGHFLDWDDESQQMMIDIQFESLDVFDFIGILRKSPNAKPA